MYSLTGLGGRPQARHYRSSRRRIDLLQAGLGGSVSSKTTVRSYIICSLQNSFQQGNLPEDEVAGKKTEWNGYG